MAIYHLSVKNVSRAGDRSAVAAAAYRAGAKLRDQAGNRVHDYSKRTGVVHSELLLPAGAPSWTTDREALWNAVEAAEARKDARLAKEVEIALPRELGREQNIDLARAFAGEWFAARGIVADLSVHDAGDGNPHAHILLATRSLAPDGFGGKDRRLDNRAFLEKVREEWEGRANAALAQAGVAARIDHRTLEAQGIDREPGEHRGPAQREDADAESAAGQHRRIENLKAALAPQTTEGEGAGEADEEAPQETAGGGVGLVSALDDVERRLAAYLSSTAEERARQKQLDEAAHQFNAYILRIQRQQAYLQNLKGHRQRVVEQQQRSVATLFGSFAATYRDPDRSFQSIWKMFKSGGRSKVRFLLQSQPSAFGKLQGWSFLFFNSPKRRQAMRTSYALPDQLTRWIESEQRVQEAEHRVQEVSLEIDAAATRAAEMQTAVQSASPTKLDPVADRDIRVRLFQERNQILARVAPEEIAASPLPPDRKNMLLSIAVRYRDQYAQECSGR